MSDGRLAHHRHDESMDKYAGKHGGKERKFFSNARYAPYEKNKVHAWRVKDKPEHRDVVYQRRGESYAHRSHTESKEGYSLII